MIYNEDRAIFIDADKTLIQVECVNDEGDTLELHVEVTPSPTFNEFIEQVSLEKVEANTVEYEKKVKEVNDKWENDLVKRIKRELDVSSNIIATDRAPEPVAAPFDPTNMTTEDLFKLKLQAFEIEEVKTSKNRDLKARVRKATSFMEVLAFTSATILDNQK